VKTAYTAAGWSPLDAQDNGRELLPARLRVKRKPAPDRVPVRPAPACPL